MPKVQCKISGLDDLIRDIQSKIEQCPDTFRELMVAGCEEVKTAWKNAAKKHSLKDTGEMIDAIDYDSKVKGGGVYTSYIYPRGYARHTSAKTRGGRRVYTRHDRNRHAVKAFILHYGGRRRRATYWVDDAIAEADRTVPEKLTRIWHDYIEGGGKDGK